MMAFSGVRSSWLILARNFDHGVGFLGAGFFLGVFLGQFGQLLRGAQIRNGRDLRFSLSTSFFVSFERGDVGADRHVTAVLGAALADVQPASVLKLRFSRYASCT